MHIKIWVMKPFINILLCLLALQLIAQEPVWIQMENHYPDLLAGSQIAVDQNNEIYVVSDWVLSGSYHQLSKIINYSPEGNKEWTYDWHVDSVHTFGISTNRNGNTYIVRSWWAYLHYTRILSVDNSGNETFSKGYKGLNFYDVISDNSNNSYVTGFGFIPYYDEEMLLMKFDSSGNVQWQTFWGIPNHEIVGKKILLDEDLNIYVAGSFKNSYLSSFMLAKFNPNGELEDYTLFVIDDGYWYKSLYRFSIDQDKNLYVTGRYEEDEAWDKYGFIYKFDSTLTKQWHDSTSLHFHAFYDLVIDEDKNIILSGSECHNYYDYPHATYVKYTENGTKLWHYTNDSVKSSFGSISIKANNYFLTGRLENIDKDNFEIITMKVNSDGQITGSHIIEGLDNTFSYGSDNVIDNMGKLICTGSFRDTTHNCLTVKYDALTFEEDIIQNIPDLMKVYPNPARSNINIQLELNEFNSVEFRLYNLTGEIIKHQTINNFQPGLNTFSINTNGISNGIYMLKCKSGNKTFSQKVLITK